MKLFLPLVSFSQDLRYGLRTLRNSPGFATVTALTLALGIGANTAIFSVIDSVMLGPLPYKDSDRVVAVWDKDPHGGRKGYSSASLLERREQNRVFQNFAGWATAAFNLSGQDVPDHVDGMLVSWDFFNTLGVTPALGRSFTADDDRPEAPRVAMLSHGLWQRRFGADQGIVGRSVTVDGQNCTVIGVMPRPFRFFYGPEMWMPLALNRTSAGRDVIYLSAIGRLRPGVSLIGTRAQWGGLVEPMRAASRQEQPRILLVLFGAVGFVLLIACVNVANLFLAKAAARQRELAVRASLGASRIRLVRQLLTESILLALAGGLLGLLLAFWLVQLLPALVPPVLLSGSPEMTLNWRVLAFTFALSILTGLFFGVFPAWSACSPDLHEVLKEGGRTMSDASGHTRLRNALVVVEVALSLVLLACAGLMIRSLVAMQSVDLGFRPDHMLTMRLMAAEARYPGAAPLRAFYLQVLQRVSSIAAIRSASISLGGAPWETEIAGEFDIAGHPRASSSEMRAAAFETVTQDYFRTMGIALRRGRFFTFTDDENGQRVVIVNQTFVSMYLSKDEPLGQKLLIRELTGTRQIGRQIGMEIVGVVADVKFGGPAANSVPFIYMNAIQSPLANSAITLRTSAEPMSVVKSVRAALAQIDRETPVARVRPMDQIVVDSMAQPRTQAWLMGVFAAIALALAAVGNYGVMSYLVAQSTHDMGIHMALGASAWNVLRLVLRKAILLTGAGLLLGLAGALAVTRMLSTMLFHVKATDPWTFVAVSLLLVFVALVAAFIPARRVTQIDPVVALRCE
jgi:putative ABC transport system permease protein